MLDFNSIMVGTTNLKAMGDFYGQVFAKEPDMSDPSGVGWMVGSAFFGLMEHSEATGQSPQPARFMPTFATLEVTAEFDRLKGLGATVIKEPYQMEQAWIATLQDPDGNYFQLMTPWQE